MMGINGGPPELDISFSGDISKSGDHWNWLTPDSTTSSRALPLWRPMARDYIIPLTYCFIYINEILVNCIIFFRYILFWWYLQKWNYVSTRHMTSQWQCTWGCSWIWCQPIQVISTFGDISRKGGPPFVLIIVLVTFPQPDIRSLS